MIFPSIGSCKNKCGSNNLDSGSDCSCDVDCLRIGNCCDNFENECHLEISIIIFIIF